MAYTAYRVLKAPIDQIERFMTEAIADAGSRSVRLSCFTPMTRPSTRLWSRARRMVVAPALSPSWWRTSLTLLSSANLC